MDDVRVALVGYGLAGRVLHRPLLQAQPGLRITHVVTGDPGRRAQAQQELPDAQVLHAVEQLWSTHSSFDLVVVATSNDAHVPVACSAADLGKATVVDKPMALTAAHAAELVAKARSRGVLLSVFHNRRWDSDTLTAAALLEQGRLGQPLRLESRFARFRPQVARRWRETPEAGGGVLLDLGTHLVDQALHLLGPATSVYAEVDTVRAGAVVDDDCFLALTHRSGARSHLWVSMAAPRPGPRLVLTGSEAAYAKDQLDGQEDALRQGHAPGGVAEPPGTLSRENGEEPVPSVSGDWPAYYRGVVAALRGEQPVPVPAEDGVQVLRVLEAARRSAAERQVVTL